MCRSLSSGAQSCRTRPNVSLQLYKLSDVACFCRTMLCASSHYANRHHAMMHIHRKCVYVYIVCIHTYRHTCMHAYMSRTHIFCLCICICMNKSIEKPNVELHGYTDMQLCRVQRCLKVLLTSRVFVIDPEALMNPNSQNLKALPSPKLSANRKHPNKPLEPQ